MDRDDVRELTVLLNQIYDRDFNDADNNQLVRDLHGALRSALNCIRNFAEGLEDTEKRLRRLELDAKGVGGCR